MNREEAHQLVDRLFDSETTNPTPTETEATPEEPKKELPKDKRVVRTKTSGDTVYYLDEKDKTRQRIVGSTQYPGPDLVKGLGFDMSDVGEIDDTTMMTYRMGPPIYKLNDEPTA